MRWQWFLDSLDTGGGHILLLAVGVAAGGYLALHGSDVGKTVLVGAGGALLPLLRSKSS